MKQTLRTVSAVIILFVILSTPLFSADLESIDVKGGLLWIGNAGSAPPPLTTITALSFPIRFNSYFLLVPEVRYFGLAYGMQSGRAVPVEEEYANWAFVMGLLLEPRAVFDFAVHPALNLGAYATTAFLARIPARRWGAPDVPAIAAYQYQKMRFFYPEFGVYLDWKVPLHVSSPEADAVNEGEFGRTGGDEPFKMQLLVDLNVYLPLFHAWDGEGSIGFYDQLMVSGTVGLRFYLDTLIGANNEPAAGESTENTGQ
jgi:hypothetical protein